MNPPIDLTISIVGVDNRALLQRCLRSIEKSTHGLQLQVVFVDNACTDGSAEMVARDFPYVEVIVNHQRLGFSASHNRALERGVGRYLLILNDDTEALPGCLEIMVAFMDAHPEAGACGPKLLNPDGSLQRTANRFPTLLYGIFEATGVNWRIPNNRVKRDNIYADWDRTTLREVDAVSGAALMVRREAMADSGLLDDSFFLYSEEVDWCLRMHRNGWKVYYLPDAQLIHYGGQSTTARAPQKYQDIRWQSFLYYYRKHFGAAVYWMLKVILETRLFFRKLMSPSLAPLSNPK
jgi:GT2 family glycosyltransferase